MSIEEGAKAANTFMEVMRGNPLGLALVVMNLGLVGYIYYGGIVAHTERLEELKLK